MLQWTFCNQCCGAKTFCFRSGSDFQKVSALAPEPAPTLALYVRYLLSQISFYKVDFSCFLRKNINLIHMLDSIGTI
jgi:hypothetical protein